MSNPSVRTLKPNRPEKGPMSIPVTLDQVRSTMSGSGTPAAIDNNILFKKLENIDEKLDKIISYLRSDPRSIVSAPMPSAPIDPHYKLRLFD